MNIYDDVIDATQVSNAVVGNFTTHQYSELLISRTNLLSIYKVSKGKLILKHEFKLHGAIVDMALVPQADGELDCLILSTGKAKLSIVRFNVNMPIQLETLSLHYYEAEFEKRSIIKLAKTSKLRVDPQRRCVILFNNDCLAVLYLKDEDEDDEQEEIYHQDKKQKVTDKETGPYSRSVIISATGLNSGIKNVIDINFLNSFNRPTIAVLYQPRLAWCGNEKVGGENTTRLLALTLNENKNTTIFELQGLPFDTHTIIPLSNSIVLVGVNELINVDNTGALQAFIQLNAFSSKNLATRRIDNSSLNVMFSDPVVWTSKMVAKDRELLLTVDHSGEMYCVSLQSEGRLLTDFCLTKVPIVNSTFKSNSIPTCIVPVNSQLSLKDSQLFFGFLSGDALLVKINNLQSIFDTQHTQTVDIKADEDEEYEDLYGDEESNSNSKKGDQKVVVETIAPFDNEVTDRLMNIGPITSLTVGKVSSLQRNVEGLPNPNMNEYSIITTSGNGSGSHLAVVQPSVQPTVQQVFKFTSVTQIWNLKIRNKDKYLVTTDSGAEKSDVFEINRKFTLLKPKHFKRNMTTVEIAIIGGGKRIVQVTTKAVYLLNLGFKKLMTISFDFEVVHVSVLDPFILLTNSKGEIKIYELESKHRKKLVKVKLPMALEEMIITSGVILKSSICNKFIVGLEDSSAEQLLFTFVTADNQIIFFPKEHHDRIFQLNGVDQLNEMLFISTYQLPEEINPDPSIKQVMINMLGRDKKEEFLTILTFGGEIYMYKKIGSRFFKSSCCNDLLITGAPDNAYAKGVSSIERTACYVQACNGYSVILVTGNVPYIIVKEDFSSPKIYRFTNIPLVSLAPWGKNSVLCVDDIKNARIVTLDLSCSYGNRLPLKRIIIEDALNEFETLNNITYHEKSEMYIVSYTKEIPYEALSEEGDRLVGYKDGVPHAKGFKSGILLLNPITWNIIDKAEYEKNSLINDMKSMILQLNSRTKRKREYVVIGNTFVRDEDIGTMGSLYLYDITEVVPEPGKPDTNFKLKQIFHEEFRGAVSSVCEISGRFLISESQKVLVRDVQEDNSVVPVAFLDVPVFVTDSKSFGNLLLIGDAMQGFQFIGFDAEPYRMISLGRSVTKLETMCVEFLVNNGDVFFLVSDRENILHVLKYAPDEPNSLSGQKLVHFTSFNLLAANTCMKLLPKNREFPTAGASQSFQVIGAQTDGSIFKVVPLTEASYRRLYVVQQHLIDKEIQPCGLNPKMERLQNEYYQLGHLMRPLLDFTVIKTFGNLPINKRKQLASKAGRQAHFDIWRDLIEVEYSLRSLAK